MSRFAVACAHFADRQMMKVLIQTDRLLNAILVDLLFEIAVPIQQTDRDEIQIEIAGRFAMVAGENAETAGIIRDRFVKTELCRKIGDRFLDRAAGSGFPVGILAREIISKRVVNFLQLAQETFVLCDFDQPRLARELKHAHRIVIGAVPQVRDRDGERDGARTVPTSTKD